MTNTAKPPVLEFDWDYAAEQLRRSNHPLRRLIKDFYIRRVLREVRGASIDFGCGAGQLLSRLPAGSVGIEVNPYLIESLRANGHIIHEAHADMRDFELAGLPVGTYRTLVISHVFEHLPDPSAALNLLLGACARLGIERVIAVVPGAKGFASDATHKTYINRQWLEANTLVQQHGFVRGACAYFPGPWEWVGDYFVYNEMQVVFERVGAAGQA